MAIKIVLQIHNVFLIKKEMTEGFLKKVWRMFASLAESIALLFVCLPVCKVWNDG